MPSSRVCTKEEHMLIPEVIIPNTLRVKTLITCSARADNSFTKMLMLFYGKG